MIVDGKIERKIGREMEFRKIKVRSTLTVVLMLCENNPQNSLQSTPWSFRIDCHLNFSTFSEKLCSMNLLQIFNKLFYTVLEGKLNCRYSGREAVPVGGH